MKPTVGRIVHYQRATQDGSETLAAVIVKVHGDACVNLSVFDPDAFGVFGVQSCTIGTSDGMWQWPVIAPALAPVAPPVQS